ncbi:MAG TPA: hypothetical protein VM347_09690 [Nonomuraea sp.]|nr:hypothetical protein [Nonomuraea sp.]
MMATVASVGLPTPIGPLVLAVTDGLATSGWRRRERPGERLGLAEVHDPDRTAFAAAERNALRLSCPVIWEHVREKTAEPVHRKICTDVTQGRGRNLVDSGKTGLPSTTTSALDAGEDAWPRLLDALVHWRPLHEDHLAPIALLADPRAARLITPERGRELLATSRGCPTRGPGEAWIGPVRRQAVPACSDSDNSDSRH